MQIINKPSVLTVAMNSAVQLKLKCFISVPLFSIIGNSTLRELSHFGNASCVTDF